MTTSPSLRYGAVAFALFFVLVVYQNAFSSETVVAINQTPQLVVDSSVIPEAVSAKAYLVKDLNTGRVWHSQSAGEVLPIASVTKLFTAATLVKNHDLEQIASINWSDLAAEGRAGKLKWGEKYTWRELLFPLLLESSNDAAAVYERELSDVLSKEIREIIAAAGLTKTKISDASGLSDANVSTAHELATFLGYLNSEQPYVLDITKLKGYVAENNGWINNSPVLDRAYVGGKHGYTLAANRTLAAIYDEEIDGRAVRLAYVLLGSDDLASDMAKLRAYTATAARFE
jgi:serine-type D-Ala-D-Ala carboxypeptidase (penicillin-binding protein 5/6)